MTQATDVLPDIETLQAGSQVDEYRIESILGIGGFGITYQATDTHLNHAVALKEYFPPEWSYRSRDGVTVHSKTQGQKTSSEAQFSNYEWGLERFLEEARVLADIQHPYVVRIKRFFRANGTAYIVMDYEEGAPLSAFLGDGVTLSESEIRGILEDVLPALQAVHDQGYLHRDIKPDNLYVRARDHRVMLIDFGAARQAVGQRSLSVISLVSPGYSPPEQYASGSERYGNWTDIYALGAVLYRCITGRTPPDAATRLLEDNLEPAVKAGGGLYSPALLAVTDHALALRPWDRYQNVAAMRAALEAAPPTPAVASPAVASPAAGYDGEATLELVNLAPGSGQPLVDSVATPTPQGWEIHPGTAQSPGPGQTAISQVAQTTEQLPEAAETEGNDNASEAATQPVAVSAGPPPSRRGWLVLAGGVAVVALALLGSLGLRLLPAKDSAAPPRYALKDGVLQFNNPVLPEQSPAPQPAPLVIPESPAGERSAPGGQPPTPATTPTVAEEKPASDSQDLVQKPAADSGDLTAPDGSGKAAEPAGDGIERLLLKAKESVAANRLTTPRKDNALYYYQQVLLRDPDNPSAQQGIAAIASIQERLARRALDNHQYVQARGHIAAGLAAVPDHAELLALRDQLPPPPPRASPRPQTRPSDDGLPKRILKNIKGLFSGGRSADSESAGYKDK